MPFAVRNGVRLYWKLDGDAERPALVLLNAIGTDLALWDTCMPHLLPAFRVLRLDARGHGASDPADGDYGLAMLAADVTAVMDAAGVARAAIVGVSLGGMVAMALALDHPERVDALALICSSATMDGGVWADRIATVRAEGMAAVADLAMARFLSPAFVQTHAAVAAGVRRTLLTMDARGFDSGVRRTNARGSVLHARDHLFVAGAVVLAAVAVTTSVLTGAWDPVFVGG